MSDDDTHRKRKRSRYDDDSSSSSSSLSSSDEKERRKHSKKRRRQRRHDKRKRKKRSYSSDSSSSDDSSVYHRRKRRKKLKKEKKKRSKKRRYDSDSSVNDKGEEKLQEATGHLSSGKLDGSCLPTEPLPQSDFVPAVPYRIPQARGVPLFLPRHKERPKPNISLKKSRGGTIVAQSMQAKGPDGTIGFVLGWTKRKSQYS